VNFAFNDLAHLPNPQFQQFSGKNMTAESNTYGVQGGFTKRNADKWAMGATYLWQRKVTHDVYPVPFNLPGAFDSSCTQPITFSAVGLSCNVPITLQPYVADNTWYDNPVAQKITLNGSYQAPWGLTIAANYLWGNHGFSTPTYAADPTLTSSSGSYRVVPLGNAPATAAGLALVPACTAALAIDKVGCLIPRFTLQTPDISKLDVRLTKAINTGTRVKLNAILEVFNVLNRVNVSGTAAGLTTANFGQPSTSTNITYYPRMAQLAFRATF